MRPWNPLLNQKHQEDKERESDPTDPAMTRGELIAGGNCVATDDDQEQN